MLEIYLKNEGYVVLKASDGAEALELLENNEVDLIILDVMMPRMDGLQACMKIREEKQMPIIMLSAKTQEIYFHVFSCHTVFETKLPVFAEDRISKLEE